MKPKYIQILLTKLTEEELHQLNSGNIRFAMRIAKLKDELFDELTNE